MLSKPQLSNHNARSQAQGQRQRPNASRVRRAAGALGGTRSSSRGFSMLETLVTLFIIAIWLLGSAGVQTIAMKLNKSSAMRNQAILIAADIGERMENNRSAAADGKYEIKRKAPVEKFDCITKSCTPNELANHDLGEVYKRAVDSDFDLDIKKIKGTKDEPTVTYTIEVSWVDRKGNQTYASGAEETGTYLSSKTVYRAVAVKGKG